MCMLMWADMRMCVSMHFAYYNALELQIILHFVNQSKPCYLPGTSSNVTLLCFQHATLGRMSPHVLVEASPLKRTRATVATTRLTPALPEVVDYAPHTCIFLLHNSITLYKKFLHACLDVPLSDCFLHNKFLSCIWSLVLSYLLHVVAH